MKINDTPVIIKGPDDKKILFVLGKGDIDTHYGSIETSKIHKLPTKYTTSIGTEVLIYIPSYSDFIINMKRGVQIIYPKDVSSITSLEFNLINSFPTKPVPHPISQIGPSS